MHDSYDIIVFGGHYLLWVPFSRHILFQKFRYRLVVNHPKRINYVTLTSGVNLFFFPHKKIRVTDNSLYVIRKIKFKLFLVYMHMRL